MSLWWATAIVIGASAAAVAALLVISQQFEIAQSLPTEAGPELAAEMKCYARSVVHQEWPEMARGIGSRRELGAALSGCPR